jgi:ABC-type sugar transport system ATPase subunit
MHRRATGLQAPPESDASAHPSTPHITVQGLTKSYEGAAALTGVSLEFAHGEIHALVGQNGAGKSTLGKILAGVTTPDEGSLNVEGAPASFASPRDALRQGIALVHQEISLAPTLSVLENVFLGAETTVSGVIRTAPLRRQFAELVAETGFDLDPEAKAGELPLADQQKVEILRALARQARLIIFDEPTSSLGREETQRLYGVLKMLRSSGITVIYISHFLQEVLDLADRISILKEGSHVRTSTAAAETVESLIHGMLGRPLAGVFPEKAPPAADAPVVLEVSGLAKHGVVDDVSFTIRAGEIVGLAGLVGSGRTDVARLVFGASRADAGTVRLNGEALKVRSPRDAIRAGIAYLSESRKDDGLLFSRSVRENLTLASLESHERLGIVSGKREAEVADQVAKQLDITPADPERNVATLSGGNQQKVMLGRWLLCEPKVLIVDEPSRGVDIGARAAINRIMHALAERGVAILLISSEMEEVMGLSHRILVLHQGRLAAELAGDADEEPILNAAFGRRQEVAS